MTNMPEKQNQHTGASLSVFVAAILLWSIAAFCLALATRYLPPLLPFHSETHPVIQLLKRERITALVQIITLLLVPILTLLISFLLNWSRKKRHLPTPPRPKLWLTALLCIAAVQSVIAVFLILQTDYPDQIRKINQDFALLDEGHISSYEGSIRSDYDSSQLGRYTLSSYGGYYWLRIGDETLRCPIGFYDGSLLLSPPYTVEYLPNTGTLWEISDEKGSLTGTGARAVFSMPEGYWLHDDLMVRRCEEIYGYDSLSFEEQNAFDLLYGHYYAYRALEQNKQITFLLPDALSSVKLQRVLELYDANTQYITDPLFYYETNDGNNVRKISVSPTDNQETIEQFRLIQQEISQILLQFPTEAVQAEQVEYLVLALADTAQYSDSGSASPYAVLIGDTANADGFAHAFDLLARNAGLSVITVEGQVSGTPQLWNMVQVEDEWYHLDLGSMVRTGQLDYTYCLADDSQIAFSHRGAKYNACGFISTPPARWTKWNWVSQNGKSFDTAYEAFTYLENLIPEINEVIYLRIDDLGERQIVFDALRSGNLPHLQMRSNFDFGNTSPVLQVIGATS